MVGAVYRDGSLPQWIGDRRPAYRMGKRTIRRREIKARPGNRFDVVHEVVLRQGDVLLERLVHAYIEQKAE